MAPKLTFAQFMAFLLPGLPVVHAMACVSETIRNVWAPVRDQGDVTVGGSLFVLVLVLAAGLCLNSVRALIVDVAIGIHDLILSTLGKLGPESSWKIDYGNVTHERLPVVLAALDRVYAEVQFTGNMAMGLVVLWCLRAWCLRDLLGDNMQVLIIVLAVVLAGAAVVGFIASRATLRNVVA